jgi:UDP-2-acetamido-3-amino-2,3-dideoxy-glucuronate N-acetyltransferase
MAEKGIAVIGCGYWGRNLVRNFYELGALAVVCDKDREACAGLKEKFPGIEIIADFKQILGLPQIKAVAIATPALSHYALAREAVLAGKDVFVEKPLSTNTKDAQELIELAQRQKKILMVGHILQYHPAVLKLKEIIRQGKLGKLEYIYSNRLNIGKLRTEENILWSFAPHDISVILALTGQEPIEVSAFGADFLNKDIYDITLTTLKFKGEIKAHIFVSWLHPFKEQKLIVVGSQAMAVFDDLSEEKLFIYPHRIEWNNGKIPVAQKAEHYSLPIEKKEPIKEELGHFLECVEHREVPRTDGQEGLRVLRVLEAAEKSLI